MQKFIDIIHRAEEVRKSLRLNKAQFSARIGIKPQTYNNFVGSQGSKPNMELFDGIVRVFNVNPMWLLSGSGEAFLSPFTDGTPVGPEPVRHKPPLSRPHETPPSLRHDESAIRSLKQELDTLLAVYRGGLLPTIQGARNPDPHVAYALELITYLFWSSPVDTAAQAVAMLEEFSRLAENLAWHAQRSGLQQAGA